MVPRNVARGPSAAARKSIAAAAVAAVLFGAAPAGAVDNSPAPILQWFDSSYKTIEARAADVFMAGYGAVWTPPPGRADSGNFSVGYDVYDRFNLGSAGNPTLYGTETGIKAMANQVHRAGIDVHVDFVINHNGFSGTNDAATNAAFKAAGGYPGFFMDRPGDADGDFHSAFASGDIQGRLSGLIDIAHEKNYQAIRNPVPGFANNLPAGTTPQFGRLANVPTETNRRFYPDKSQQPMMLFDPRTGEQNIPVYPFNLNDPMAGDPVEENAMGYLMRNAQWLVQEVGVDGFRIDAAKHVESFALDYLDRAVYRSNPRKLLDGSTKHVFSYSEVFDGSADVLLSHVKKTINPSDPGRIGANRDTLDFKLYFALKANLENTGTSNAWQNIKSASIDFADDGLHNGSAGVKFVFNHDVFKPAALDSVAQAYVLTMPGNAAVYFNGKEFGDNRDFPKDGRSDALSVRGNGSQITRLNEIRSTHGRGNYAERFIDNQGVFAFERVGSMITLLSNRGDGGFDSRTLNNVGFAPGTHLIEMTGNASDPAVDPNNDIPEVVTVGANNTLNVRFPRNANANGTFHGRGYAVYGLPTPQSANGLELSNVAQVLPGSNNITNNFQNGTTRQTDLHVIKADTFNVSLQTNEVRLLGQDALRDVWADGDSALLKFDGGRDVNGNGQVDNRTPDSVVYGFEQFTTKRSPLIGSGGLNGPRGDGQFVQAIEATNLEEGYHFLESRAFRHRTDGGPAVYSSFKKVIYVDRLKPVSGVADFNPWDAANPQNRDLRVRSLDQTADAVHVFFNLPAATTDAQVLAMVGGGNKAQQVDRDLFKFGLFDVKNGNNVATVVTYEITGTVNVQRLTGLSPATGQGRGLGDLNFSNSFETGDVAGTAYGFESVLYARDTRFNPAADLNGDGRITNHDLYQLPATLQSSGAAGPVVAEARAAVRRRGDVNSSGATNAGDIDSLFRQRGATGDVWQLDLNVDGSVTKADVDVLVGTIFGTHYGDTDLDGSVGLVDFSVLAGNYGRSNLGWAAGDFDGDGAVNLLDFSILATNYGLNGSGVASNVSAEELAALQAFAAAVPEPASYTLVAASAGLAALRRRRRRHH